MKWRAEIRVDLDRDIVKIEHDVSRFTEKQWHDLQSFDGVVHGQGGTCYYVEVDDSELPEMPV